MSKYPLGVGIYDLNDNLISKFNNNVELAKYLNISKVTVGKYLKSGKIYKNLGSAGLAGGASHAYRFKIIQDYYKLTFFWNQNL